MREHDFFRFVAGKVDRRAVNQSAAGIDFFYCGGYQIAGMNRPGVVGRQPAVCGGIGYQLCQHWNRDNVGKVRVSAVAVIATHAESEHGVFDRVRRVDRHHLHAVTIVPLLGDQVVNVEQIGEQRFFDRHQRRQLFRD